jgi:hypothetical protein
LDRFKRIWRRKFCRQEDEWERQYFLCCIWYQKSGFDTDDDTYEAGEKEEFEFVHLGRGFGGHGGGENENMGQSRSKDEDEED